MARFVVADGQIDEGPSLLASPFFPAKNNQVKCICPITRTGSIVFELSHLQTGGDKVLT